MGLRIFLLGLVPLFTGSALVCGAEQRPQLRGPTPTAKKKTRKVNPRFDKGPARTKLFVEVPTQRKVSTKKGKDGIDEVVRPTYTGVRRTPVNDLKKLKKRRLRFVKNKNQMKKKKAEEQKKKREEEEEKKKKILAQRTLASIAKAPEKDPNYTGPTTATNEFLPPSPTVSVVLSKNRFYPARIRLAEGVETTLVFATVNKKPVALIIEHLKTERWMAKDKKTNSERVLASTAVHTEGGDKFNSADLRKEVTNNRIYELTFKPTRGVYPFYDALSGAEGELVVVVQD